MLTIVIMKVVRWCRRILVLVAMVVACLPIGGIAEAAPGVATAPMSGCCEDCDPTDDFYCIVTVCAPQPAMVAPAMLVGLDLRIGFICVLVNEQAHDYLPGIETPPPRLDREIATIV
jgi:hypothetical protein